MDIPNSECSSGCESGWTMYFDQFSNSNNDPYSNNYLDQAGKSGAPYDVINYEADDDDDDQDLSMVSDATSGPPHLHQNYAYETTSYSVSEDRMKSKQKISSKPKEVVKVKRNVVKHKNLCLDDTASSHFSQDNVAHPPDDQNHVHGFSQVSSAAHFQGESMPKKQYFSFLKSSTKGKSGSLLGRKRDS